MPRLISFAEAIAETQDARRNLLLGAGFSAEFFTYASLLERADLQPDEPLRQLFDALDTVDFEAVIKALEDARIVAETLGGTSNGYFA